MVGRVAQVDVNASDRLYVWISGHDDLVVQSDAFWWECGQVQRNQSGPARKRPRVSKSGGARTIGDGSGYARTIGDGSGDALAVGDASGDALTIGDVTGFWGRCA